MSLRAQRVENVTMSSVPRRPARMRRALGAALAAVATLAVLPSLAHANTVKSDNWSGYAIHRTGVSFRHVTGSWTQPAGSCSSETSSYSAFWVGLGGYSSGSDALEQIGTELDCSATGTEKMSAWYELVPKASRTVALTISAGDKITASVTVVGTKVTLTLDDVTTGKSFTHVSVDKDIDVTSAEWITEAPSECEGSTTSDCTTLPLADFGTVDFTGARAVTSTGATASIVSSRWTTTKLVLDSSGSTEGPGQFVSDTTAATATPTASAGGAFEVAYAASSSSSSSSGSTGTSTGSGTGDTGGSGDGGPGTGAGGGWSGPWSGDVRR
jgi:hypothetical protein